VTQRNVTTDALFGGRITLLQPAQGTGYRTNVDAILLGAFAAAGDRVARAAVDLGAGVGAVGLTLFFLGAAVDITFIEKDAALAELCRKNLKANRFEGKSHVVVADLEERLEAAAPSVVHAADLVVANPPYFTPERDGRAPPNRNAAARRSARHGNLAPFVRAAASALGRRGRACIVYPAHALLELTSLAEHAGLVPKRLRFVHGKASRPARIALIELAPAKPGELVVLPPLVEVGLDGKPTPELAELLRKHG
jgi:tRNA1Val (adenine37-N6)-methyltransferase